MFLSTYLSARMREHLEPRFWPKVLVTDSCWWWTASLSHGYGDIFAPPGYRQKLMRSTHAAWFLLTGEIVDRGVHLCHECDNPPCVNPAHLFKGNPTDNIQDCISKGRFKFLKSRKGEANNKAKLTDERAAELRRRYAAGENLSDLSRSMGMARSTLREVVMGRNWRVDGVQSRPRLKPTAKLTDSDKRAIVSMRLRGAPYAEIQRAFGIHSCTVLRLWRKRDLYAPQGPSDAVVQHEATR